MDDSCGLDYFGADDAKSGEGGFVSFLKKEGPSLFANVSEAIKEATAPGTTPTTDKLATPDKGKDKKSKGGGGSGGSWFTEPALGPIPGGGVLALGLALAGLLGFGVFKMVR